MTATRFLSLAAAAVVLGGCIEGRTEVATISLDYLTGEQAAELARPYLSKDGTLFMSHAALNAITVRDRSDNLRQVRRVIGERDASPQNVALHFQVVRATKAGGIDPALAKVGAALRELLKFEGYELVAQTMVSAAERRVVEQSILAGDMPLQLALRVNDIAGGSGSVDMEVDLRRAGYPSLLTTNVVVPLGQTVVLGSAYPGVEGEALILTVRGERGSAKLRSTSRRTHDGVHVETAARAEAAAEAAGAAAAAAAGIAHEVIDIEVHPAKVRGAAIGVTDVIVMPGARTKSTVTTGKGIPASPRARAGQVPPGSRR